MTIKLSQAAIDRVDPLKISQPAVARAKLLRANSLLPDGQNALDAAIDFYRLVMTRQNQNEFYVRREIIICREVIHILSLPEEEVQ